MTPRVNCFNNFSIDRVFDLEDVDELVVDICDEVGFSSRKFEPLEEFFSGLGALLKGV